MGLAARKRVFGGLRTTQAQTSLRSLISAFVICLLESILYKLATSEISIFQVVSVAEQAGLGMTISETPKTGFLASRPICFGCSISFFLVSTTYVLVEK